MKKLSKALSAACIAALSMQAQASLITQEIVDSLQKEQQRIDQWEQTAGQSIAQVLSRERMRRLYELVKQAGDDEVYQAVSQAVSDSPEQIDAAVASLELEGEVAKLLRNTPFKSLGQYHYFSERLTDVMMALEFEKLKFLHCDQDRFVASAEDWQQLLKANTDTEANAFAGVSAEDELSFYSRMLSLNSQPFDIACQVEASELAAARPVYEKLSAAGKFGLNRFLSRGE